MKPLKIRHRVGSKNNHDPHDVPAGDYQSLITMPRRSDLSLNVANEFIHLENFDPERHDGRDPVLTSPRSIEACRMLGVEPEDLLKQPIEHFYSKQAIQSEDDEVFVAKRAARYEKDRQIQLERVRTQRHELITAGIHGIQENMSPVLKSLCRSPDAAKFSLGRMDSREFSREREFTVIQKEKRELERIRLRQANEMQQMLAYELKMAAIEQERELKDRAMKRQEEMLMKERKRRQREVDEQKRKHDTEKAELHRLELETARREAQEQQQEVMRRKQRQHKEEERRKREARIAEMERQRRQEEVRLHNERIMLKQAREIARKEREIERRDERRRQMLEQQKQRKAQEIAEKQQRNKMRITGMIQEKELLKAFQLQAAERKQQESEERRRKLEQDREQKEQEVGLQALSKRETIELVQQHAAAMGLLRRERLLEQEEQLQRRRRMREIERQIEREEQKREELRQEEERRRAYERMQQQKKERQQAHFAKEAEKALMTQVMLEQKRQLIRDRLQDAKVREEEIHVAITRKQKQDEYRTNLLLSRLENDDARTRKLKQQRQELLRRRQQIKQTASRQKQEMLDTFHRIRVTKKYELPQHLIAKMLVPTQSMPELELNTQAKAPRVKRIRGVMGRSSSTSSALSKSSSKNTTKSENSESSDEWDNDERHTMRRDEEDADDDSSDTDKSSICIEISQLRKRQNDELLVVLQQEHHAEEQRVHLESQTIDPAEKARLNQIFNKERAHASDRIMSLTQEHEQALANLIGTKVPSGST